MLAITALEKATERVSPPSPSSVEPRSPSQHQSKLPHRRISHACHHQHVYTKLLRRHDCMSREKLNYIWWKAALKEIHEAAFPGSSLPHLIFRGLVINFKLRPGQLLEICPGTLWTTLKLSRWIIHWITTSLWGYLHDIVRTQRTRFEKN